MHSLHGFLGKHHGWTCYGMLLCYFCIMDSWSVSSQRKQLYVWHDKTTPLIWSSCFFVVYDFHQYTYQFCYLNAVFNGCSWGISCGFSHSLILCRTGELWVRRPSKSWEAFSWKTITIVGWICNPGAASCEEHMKKASCKNFLRCLNGNRNDNVDLISQFIKFFAFWIWHCE